MKDDLKIGKPDSITSIATGNMKLTQRAGKHRQHMDMKHVKKAVLCKTEARARTLYAGRDEETNAKRGMDEVRGTEQRRREAKKRRTLDHTKGSTNRRRI